jgi:replicative DNA helicase
VERINRLLLLVSDDTQAEQTLLGTLIQFPATFSDVAKRITARDFFHPRNQFIYEAALGLWSEGNPISPESLCAELGRLKLLNKVGGAPYLTDLIQAQTTADAADYYVRIVTDKSRLRRIKDLGSRLVQVSESESDAAVEAVHKFLEEAEVDREAPSDSFDSAYKAWVNWYDDDSSAIPTQWPGVNQMLLGGYHRGRLYLVTARPGAGKSTLALNSVCHAAKCRYRSVTYSMEMPKEECAARILANAANVPLKNIFRHDLRADELERIQNFSTDDRRHYMPIDDNPSQTIESVMADCRARKKRGLDLVVIDHSILLNPTDKKWSLHQQVNHVAKQSKLLARRLDVAVILCHQMNRAFDKDTRKPRLSDLREGGEMDADVVIALERDEDNHQIIAHPLKNRMAPINQPAVMVDELAYGRLG